jgi:hypothetical protein
MEAMKEAGRKQYSTVLLFVSQRLPQKSERSANGATYESRGKREVRRPLFVASLEAAERQATHDSHEQPTKERRPFDKSFESAPHSFIHLAIRMSERQRRAI